MSAVFRGGTSLGFGKIMNDLRSIGRALQSITRIRMPTIKPPTTNLQQIISSTSRLQKMMEGIGKARPTIPSIRVGGVGGFGVAKGAALKTGMGAAQQAFLRRDYDALHKAITRLTSEFGKTAYMTKEGQPLLQRWLKALQLRQQVTQGIWGRVPIVGGIMGGVQQYRAQREQMAGAFGALEKAGAPVGRITKAVAGITGALGPLGAVLKGVIGIGQAFAKISIATIRFGVTLAKLPFRVLSWIHRSIQSIMFTFVMFTHLFQRFFREAFGIIKNMQVATLVASGSLEGLNQNIEHAISLSTRYAIPLEKIAEGYIKAAKAGYSVAEQNEIVGASVQAATLLMSPLNQILDVTITSLKAWSMEASQAPRVLQILTNAVSRTKATWSGLATSLGYAAAAASEAGVSLRDTTAIISQFIDKGLRASRAGMAFRTMVAGLDKVIGHAVQGKMNLNKAIEVLGINWEKYADKAVLPLIDILGELNHVMADGLDTQERLALMQIFGRRYYSQIIRLAKDGSSALHGFSRSLEELNKLQESAAKMSDSLIGTFIRLRSIWMTFKVTILQQLKEPLEGLSGTLDNLKDLALRVGESLGKVFAGRAKGLADWFKRIVSGEGVEQMGSKMDAIAGRIDFWIGKIGKAAKGWMESVLSDADKDTGNIIDFIGTIMVASIKVSESVTDVFKEIFANKDVLLTIVGTITDLIVKIFPPFLNLIISSVMTIFRILSDIPLLGFEFTEKMENSLGEIQRRINIMIEGSAFEGRTKIDELGRTLEERLEEAKERVQFWGERESHLGGLRGYGIEGFTFGVLQAKHKEAQRESTQADRDWQDAARLLAATLKFKQEMEGEDAARKFNATE